jgi:hypothetical protein
VVDTVAQLDESAPIVRTFNARFDFQIEVCERFAGTILNVGANEDPAHLQARYGRRIVNADIEAWDKYMDRPNVVDRVFNCLEVPWPVDDLDVEAILLGDILEHFVPLETMQVLLEARRVAPWLAITVPEDTRIDPEKQAKVFSRNDYNLHTTVVTRELLEDWLDAADWQLERLHTADWGFDDIKGFCVLAHR